VWVDRKTTDDAFYGAHQHSHYEIVYIETGEQIRRFENCQYLPPPGSLLLIPSGVFHAWIYPAGKLCRRVGVYFEAGAFTREEWAILGPLFRSVRLYNGGVNLVPLVRALLDCADIDGGDLQRLAVRSRLVSLLAALRGLEDSCIIAPSPLNVDGRIQAILSYIADHLADPLSLDNISRNFNISKGHLCVLFRRETGATVVRHIRLMRLEETRRKIVRGMPVEEAAFSAGFNDYSNFYRAYRTCFGAMPRGLTRGGAD
jgi:AraC-like DNA-binding protein